jgi:hypothetical protein
MADRDTAVAQLEAGKELPHLRTGFPVNTSEQAASCPLALTLGVNPPLRPLTMIFVANNGLSRLPGHVAVSSIVNL